MKCQNCENNVDLPFRCPFCGGYFCADHRLPENHSCQELSTVRRRGPPPSKEQYQPANKGKSDLFGERPPASYPLRYKKPQWTSSKEILHLTISALIVMGVGLSMSTPITRWLSLFILVPEILLSSALIYAVVFFFHELAHKAAAKHYGLWAEFRMNLIGAVLTVLSIAPTPIKLISPGAVMIAGAVNKKIMGIIALAGPLTSMALTLLMFTLRFLIPINPFATLILNGAELGAWIALLNLIPFGMMDGYKVFGWNKTVWAASFVASIILLAATWLYLPF